MSEVIASTYEIKQKIGAGGGGVVYLARHLRLQKDVVLKADKRKITTDEALLRREVNVLKDLRHSNIPQVFDFFFENDTVYTVIDYIQGESLDKPLKRGEHYPQSQIVKWGCQLLGALSYLHSPIHGDPPRGYVHSDIKPANLMRIPNGDICLIDFNIALAIGEESVIGLSEGYASPEHYGIDYSTGGTDDTRKQHPSERKDVLAPSDRTSLEEMLGGPKDVFNATILHDHGDATAVESDRQSDDATAVEAPNDSTRQESIRLHSLQINASPSTNSDARKRNSKPDIPSRSSQANTGSKRKIIPDVRSDIYSVGATLYHLLSGLRPAKDAKEVIPLSKDEYSPLIVDIITKAMQPNPDLRYQSAAEMLEAFERLRLDDPRVIRLKKNKKNTFIALATLLIIGVCSTFIGLKRIQTIDRWQTLVEYSKNSLEDGDAETAVAFALQAIPEKSSILKPQLLPEAQKVLTDSLGIYDLSDSYKAYKTINLDSEPICISVSPDGSTFACINSAQISVFETEHGNELFCLPAQISALSEVEYLDNDILIFAGADGVTSYSISQNKILWTSEVGTSISISKNGQYIAFIYRDQSYAMIVDARDGAIIQKIDFAGKSQAVIANDVAANPNDNLFEINADGTNLAVSFSDGSLKIFDLANSGRDIEILDANSQYTHFEGGFYEKYFAFTATGSGNSIFVVLDTYTAEQTGGFQSSIPFSTKVQEQGIFVQTDNLLVKIDPESGEQTPMVTTNEPILVYAIGDSQSLIATKSGFSFFGKNAQLLISYKRDYRCDFLQIAADTAIVGSMDSPTLRLLRAEQHWEDEIISYDPAVRHSETRINADANKVMFFSYNSFLLYSTDGELIREVSIPSASEVYDQQFIRDEKGSRLEVTYNDGRVLSYDANDGRILSDELCERPNPSLDEEFETDEYRITAPLHGTTVVYERNSNTEVRQLTEDAFLTYVTQIDGYIVVQFVTADGYTYGQLWDSKCDVIAELPYLCDVMDNTLYFDYPTGDVRKTHIYSIEEILDIAGNVEEN